MQRLFSLMRQSQKTEKAAPNGVATLDNVGKVPASQLPGVNLGNTYAVKTMAEMLAWPSHHIEDLFIVADLHKTFVHASGKGLTAGDYLEILAPVGSVLSVNTQFGDVSLETKDIPESHDKNYVTDAELLQLKRVVTTDDKNHFRESVTVGDGAANKAAQLKIASMDGASDIMKIGRADPMSNEVSIEADNNILFTIPSGKKLTVVEGGVSRHVQLQNRHSTGLVFAPNPDIGDTFSPDGTDRLFEYDGAEWLSSSYNYIFDETKDETAAILAKKGDSYTQVDSTSGAIIKSATYDGAKWIESSAVTIADDMAKPSGIKPEGAIHLSNTGSSYSAMWVVGTDGKWTRSPARFKVNGRDLPTTGDEVVGDVVLMEDVGLEFTWDGINWSRQPTIIRIASKGSFDGKCFVADDEVITADDGYSYYVQETSPGSFRLDFKAPVSNIDPNLGNAHNVQNMMILKKADFDHIPSNSSVDYQENTVLFPDKLKDNYEDIF